MIDSLINNEILLQIEIEGWEKNELIVYIYSSSSMIIKLKLEIKNENKKINNGDILKVTIPYEYG